MRNWSTDIKKLSKHPSEYKKFMLESYINFGTNGRKINSKILSRELSKLNIDPKKKKFLKLILQ